MKKSMIILWIATLVVIVFVAFSQRYTISSNYKGFIYKLDRFTGKIWSITPDKQELITLKKEYNMKEIFQKKEFQALTLQDKRAVLTELFKFKIPLSIKEFRKKYPEYNDLSDEELTKKIYKKYFSEVSYKDFKNIFLQ